MQADLHDPLQVAEGQSSNRRRAYFNLKTNIDKWQDFKNTWRNVKFDEILNSMDEPGLAAFWKGELNQLMNEKEKICILAPFEVTRNVVNGSKQEKAQIGVNQKNSQNIEKLQVKVQKKGQQKELQKPITNTEAPIEPIEKPKTEAKKPEGEKQNKNRNNRTNAKKVQIPKIKLNPLIFQTCKRIIDESYPELSYVHESLYMGNEKQLLIYRQCSALEKYLEKYRLPNNFKEVFGEIQILVGQLFEVKVRRNEAISTFRQQDIGRSTAQYKTLELKIRDYLSKTQDYYSKVLQDFNSKDKVREIVLHNIRDQLKNILMEIVEKHQNKMINKYNLCDNDEFKDVIIVKKNDHRLNPMIIPEEETNRKVQYVYVEPEHQLQPPRDIRELTFQGINFQKQCYNYRIDLPRWGKDNRLEGLFIRCLEGEAKYEKTITIIDEVKRISVELQPYAYGKIVYQIYTWNAAGFTKSTESIVIFNELRVPGLYENNLRNHSLYMLGESQCGLLVDCQSTNDQFKKMNFVGTNLSVGNGAILCDAKGDCAGWGEMYCLGQNETKASENQDDVLLEMKLNENIKIESPVLLLSDKQIRKVSCGMGYFLMLSRFGGIWSMGFNHFGQLGLGNFNMDAQNMNPREITKFTDSSSPFIVDIKASECGASFALDETGNLYRWGLNQIEVTPYPIEDRFGTAINFTSNNILYKSPNPYKVGKQYIQGSVKQIQSGNQFYLALTEQGVLYGWGDCKYLGCGPLLDSSEQSIPDIINPKSIRSGFNFITSSFDHTVAITKDKRVLAWGNGKSFSNKFIEFYETPIDVTDEYGQFDNIRTIKSGRRFTVVVCRDNTIKLLGQSEAFIEQVYKFDGEIIDVECCYENLISVIADSKKI